MTKKKRGKRRRSFKVHSDANGIPFIKFGGKYLPKELGLTYGDRLELIHDNDMLILRKFSTEEVAQYEAIRKEKLTLALLKNLIPETSRPYASRSKQAPPVMMVAEACTTTYSVEEEIAKHPERYSQA